jgi:putative transposase
MAALAIEDLVSHKWLTTVVSVEETSAQVQPGVVHAVREPSLVRRPHDI